MTVKTYTHTQPNFNAFSDYSTPPTQSFSPSQPPPPSATSHSTPTPAGSPAWSNVRQRKHGACPSIPPPHAAWSWSTARYTYPLQSSCRKAAVTSSTPAPAERERLRVSLLRACRSRHSWQPRKTRSELRPNSYATVFGRAMPVSSVDDDDGGHIIGVSLSLLLAVLQ